MSLTRPFRITELPALFFGLMMASCLVGCAAADTLYASNQSTSGLQTIDSSSGTVTNIFADGAGPRGLVFSDAANIVYTTLAPGKLEDYNLNTHSSAVLATFNGLGNYVTVDPGGKSVTYGVGGLGIERLDLSSSAVTQVSSFGDARGLAYDNSGHLFAVLGPSSLAQIDPATGAILASITLPSTGSAGANGLAYDPVSGALFVTDDTNGSGRGLYEVSLNLTNATLVNAGLFANGLTADGKGNLWIAELNNLDEYSVGSGSLRTGAANNGMYDVALAPVTTVATPEPGSMLLLGVGLAAAGLVRKRLR